MNSSSMEHSSTLNPKGLSTSHVRSSNHVTSATGSGYTEPVKILMLAPFEYKYASKSYWVATGEWYSLDPIRDREEIIYLDSPSNPYRQFMYMEGQANVGDAEEKGDTYTYGAGYQDLVSNPPVPLRSNALLPPEEPVENPHIVETLARAGLTPTPVPIEYVNSTDMVGDEVIPTLPDVEADLPRYGDETVSGEVVDVAVIEGIEVIPQPTAYELRESELRSMKVPSLKGLATTMGLEYKDKETTIKQILSMDY